MKNLFVGNMSFQTTEGDLRSMLNHFGEDADPRSDHDRSGLGREEANLPRREADREEGSDREEQTACSTERPSHVREEPGQEARDHPSTGQTRQAERGDRKSVV